MTEETKISQKELDEFIKQNNEETSKYKRDNNKMNKTIKESQNYIMIFVMAMLQTALSCFNIENGSVVFGAPTTLWGWILFLGIKLINSVLAYLIFVSFMDEGKRLGVQSNNYKLAQQKILQITGQSNQPLLKIESPKQYESRIKSTKGIRLIFSSLTSLFIIGDLIISFNVGSLLGSIVSLTMAIYFGLRQRDDSEDFYTNKYLLYATLLEKQFKDKNKDN